jgi:hypothetical protein
MKRAASLRTDVLFFILFFALVLTSTQANAASYSFSTTTNTRAATNPTVMGQTFKIPTGYSGTITSISNIKIETYQNTIPIVSRVKIYDSPSKTTLLATATSDFSNAPSGGFSGATAFTANFTSLNVSEGVTYYFEISRISGDGMVFYWEDGTNPYADGASYPNGSINTTYDVGFTVNISYSYPPNTISLVLTNGASQATYRTTSQLKAQIGAPGTVSFFVDGKVIPGCRKVLAVSNVSTCDWKPSKRGYPRISVTTYPSDSVNYSAVSTINSTIAVISRTDRRGG